MNSNRKSPAETGPIAHRDLDRCRMQTFSIKGYSISMSLEPEMWDALEEIGQFENRPIDALIELIHAGKPNEGNLASATRVFIINYYRLSSVAALRSPAPAHLN